jgi:prepilin-type N-terminal cleavage/methylation domain-containing protein
MNKAFTLVEVLIVVGVLAIIASFFVLILNPAQFLAQSRDSRRINDAKTLSGAVNLAKTFGDAFDYTEPNLVYISLPAINSGANDDCRLVDYPTLPALTGIWEYRCNANLSNLRKVDGSGWVPINFSSLGVKNPLSVLPSDPVNNASQGSYYTYSQGFNFSEYSITSKLDSNKYLNEVASNDGGNITDSYETRPVFWLNLGGVIAFDAASNDNGINDGQVSTFSHTIGAGSNAVLIVGVSMTKVGEDETTSVVSITYNGVALTKIRSDNDIIRFGRTELWYLLSPATGTHNVVVTLSQTIGDHFINGAVSLTGVSQVAPEANSGNLTTGTSISVDVATINTNNWVVDVVTTGGTNATKNSSQVLRYPGSANEYGGSTKGPNSPGIVTMAWTTSFSADMAISAASFSPY